MYVHTLCLDWQQSKMIIFHAYIQPFTKTGFNLTSMVTG
jgi:hypothetical protein